MLSRWPSGRRLAFSLVLCLALALSIAVLTQGLSQQGWLRALEVLAIVVTGGAIAAVVIGLIVSRMANYQDPEDEAEFERIVIRSERLARENLAAEPDEVEFMDLDPFNPDDFETLVQEALDDLPDLLIKALDRVPVVLSDKGRKGRYIPLSCGASCSPPSVVWKERGVVYEISTDATRAQLVRMANSAIRTGPR